MGVRSAVISASLSGLVAGAVFTWSAPAAALTLKECREKFQAAKSAGTLGRTKWDYFRKTECGPDAPGAPAAATPPSRPRKP